MSWLWAGTQNVCNKELGQYYKAIELHEQYLSVVDEVGDCAGQGAACSNLGHALAKNGDETGAVRVLLRGLVGLQRVEGDVGVHEDRRARGPARLGL
jgi:hypothetical protein